MVQILYLCCTHIFLLFLYILFLFNISTKNIYYKHFKTYFRIFLLYRNYGIPKNMQFCTSRLLQQSHSLFSLKGLWSSSLKCCRIKTAWSLFEKNSIRSFQTVCFNPIARIEYGWMPHKRMTQSWNVAGMSPVSCIVWVSCLGKQTRWEKTDFINNILA